VLTVCVVTNRIGGLDALFAGLREQTYRQFELVVIDELTERKGMQVAGHRPFHFHTRTFAGFPRWGNYMQALNAALAASIGDRLLFWSDYTCPHPETLATHARFHEEHPDDVMLGGIEYTELPRLHPDFPLRYGWFAMGHDVANHKDETYAPWLDDKRRHELYEEWRTNYEADLASGRLDPFMWSTFEKPVQSFADVAGLRVFNHDRRDTSPFLNLKNDSIPRKLLEKIGGFDERADGCHGHQDSITWRSLAKAGAKLQVRAENPVKLLDPHGLCLVRRFDSGKDDTSNLKIYEGTQ
jgi:hypothetical protein